MGEEGARGPGDGEADPHDDGEVDRGDEEADRGGEEADRGDGKGDRGDGEGDRGVGEGDRGDGRSAMMVMTVGMRVPVVLGRRLRGVIIVVAVVSCPGAYPSSRWYA